MAKTPCSFKSGWSWAFLRDSLAAATWGAGRARETELSGLSSNRSSAASWLCEPGEASATWTAIVHPLDEETNLDHWEGGERRGKGRGGKEEVSAYLAFYLVFWACCHVVYPYHPQISQYSHSGLYGSFQPCAFRSLSLCESSRSQMEWQKMEAKIGGDILKPWGHLSSVQGQA